MKASMKEVKFDLCHRHKQVNLSEYYPGYVFSEYIFFPTRPCKVPECDETAYHTVVGIRIPDTVGEITRENDEKLCRGIYEIFGEAKKLLDGDRAIDRLTYYLRTRIVPSSDREFLAHKLIRQYATMILNKLKIDPESSITDKNKHRILVELQLYPIDTEKS